MIRWVLKRFWFPILLFVLARLANKHAWAAKTHKTLTTVSGRKPRA